MKNSPNPEGFIILVLMNICSLWSQKDHKPLFAKKHSKLKQAVLIIN